VKSSFGSLKTLLFLLTLIIFGSLNAQAESPTNDSMRNLEKLDELKGLFQKDSAKVRIVTLLSPT
jgi:hypothetical protein